MKLTSNILMTILVLAMNSANACESVDTTIKKYEYGFSSAIDLAKSIECNLNKVTSVRQLCNTKVGLKKDELEFAKKQFDVGLVTRSTVDNLREEYQDLYNECN